MSESEWTLETLNKAYQQGYMIALAGKASTECQFQNDILIAAWEAGWDDGSTLYTSSIENKQQPKVRTA